MTDIDQATIMLTGLPRSGTTLTCSLLNKLPNCVALHEPMPVLTLARLPSSSLIEEIRTFAKQQRQTILGEGKASSQSWQGRVPLNHIGDPDDAGVRKTLLDGNEIKVGNVTHSNFSLFIKHPAFFTAALPVLTKVFDCFAIVRNPISVLFSWRNSGMAVAEGRMPAAEKFDQILSARLESVQDTVERQFILLDYCFSQYRTYLPGRILKYEEIITSGGGALSILHPEASGLDEPLESRNTLFVAKDPAAADIVKRLLDRESPCWDFYERSSVEDLRAP